MKYIFVYGGIAGAIAVTIISTMLALDLPSHSHSLWVGYLVMLTALSLIFVGIKRYRDVECGGVIRFGRAFGLGAAMAGVAGLLYALGWEIFIAASGYDFVTDYSTSILEGMRAEGATQAAIDVQVTEMQSFAETYRNPLYRVPLVFIEIFPVGLLVALVSASLLRNARLLPARA